MTAPQARETELPITVEFEDVDAFRIVHHARFVLYLERARVRYFADSGIDLTRADLHPVLYRLEIDYKKPARLLDRLTASVRLESAEAHQLTLSHRVRRGGELIAKARTTLAFFDATAGGVVPVPPEFLECLRTRTTR
jgi:acyl-CoA thioester hydrolase